ncbi:lipoprotein-releasing system permease protein [Deinobacterium chartae]|uniref:Lipoprotein-releasing system permease protein n=1 Tax=Deinobacterium chartae TaxID=521158 RepID=A0A841HXS0_9DEIO|nr:ABC transporter permease [Deinobacterium chartae]MBB6097000.1 lipoprotein-releasing system permease protein [Deinobacterium chartae]
MSPLQRSLPLALAFAHLRRRRSQNIITVLGIAIGVMVLTTALSLTNGFSRALIEATLRAVPQLALQAYGGDARRDPSLEARLRQDPEVRAYSAFLADKGLLTRPASDGRPAGVDFATLFGVEPAEAEVLDLPPEQARLLKGLRPGEVLLGAALAGNLGAFEGDRLRLLNSEQRRSELRLKGTFSTGNYLIDSGYAFVRIETLREISSRTLTGYHLRLAHADLAPEVGARLSVGTEFLPQPWQNFNATLIEQLALQKRVIGIVVFLIVIVAAFGIANVLLLTVFEKTPEIAILRAMGASRRAITATFVLEGFVLGAGGLLLGNALGLGLSYYFKLNPVRLPGDLYFITALPVDIQAADFLWVNAVSLTTTLLAALIPARRASGIQPARIIR